ncbi:hypothetical protein N9X09_03435 [Flavobacteriaceae bacterium]|nr:hypothetical protein [Flavobacteriaceae bacterium]MDC0478971.1 hypothetical protein [Flavobacteriaceae bacterium]
MPHSFNYLWVLLCFALNSLGIKAQNNSGCDFPEFYYFDNDGDGYGDGNLEMKNYIHLSGQFYDSNDAYVFSSDGEVMYGCIDIAMADSQVASFEEFVRNGSDCDDTNAEIYPGSVWYYDNDGDGDGDPSRSKAFDCAPDPKYVKRRAADCNDNDPQIHSRTVWYLDNDGDTIGGSTAFTGCTPPSNQYVLTTDDACDNDANTTSLYTWYYDSDGDGYAACAINTKACLAPENYYATADDCNDNNKFIHPKTVWYLDSDGDGWGGDQIKQTCEQPTDYVSNSSDYDDDEPCITNIYPQMYYRDADGDGEGNSKSTNYCSSRPKGYVTNNKDCNDSNRLVHSNTVWYRDSDGDGFGNPSQSRKQCSQPSGYVLNRSDINDSNVKITNITPQYFYEDQDGDGHGNPDQYLYHSVKPDTGNYVTQATDCDDTDALLHDFTLWYIDQDQDGKGYNPTKLEQTNLLRGTPDKNIAPSTVSITITGCYSGNLYVLNQDDFDDQDSDITDTLPEYYYKDSDGDQYGVEDQAKLFSQKPTYVKEI